MTTRHALFLSILTTLAATGCDPDVDGDRHPASIDCDDTDDTIHPAANEICDGVDNNCDGEVDEGLDETWYLDSDGDGYGVEDQTIEACELPLGFAEEAGDCDDSDPLYHPGAEEDCALPLDYNCDGSISYDDADGDGWAACLDCDDTNDMANPEALEICDDIDNDCDTLVDNQDDDLLADEWFIDRDDDGYGSDYLSELSCDQPEGYVDNADDCDDLDALFYPGAAETDCADPNDYNCDGSVGYTDADEDGWAACEECNDNAETGGSVNPDAEEVCDAIDNDCDGTVDGATATDATTWYYDGDEDGYGEWSTTEIACEQPEDHSAEPGDCQDDDPEISPAATEVCDDIDNDCDGEADEDDATDASTWYADADGDGYGDADDTTVSCAQPDGYGPEPGDCDDSSDAVNPDQEEVCNDGVDNDCDAEFDQCAMDVADADVVLWGESEDDEAGIAATGLGDIDGDGFDDLLVGARGDDTHADDAGVAYVAFGPLTADRSLADADAILYAEEADARAGKSVGVLPDADGDAIPDLVVGAPSSDEAGTKSGRLFVLSGADLVAGEQMLTDSGTTWVGAGSYMYAGGQLGHGDVNGDGYSDLLVGAIGVDKGAANAGAVYVLTDPMPSDGEISLSTVGDSNSGAVLTGEDADDAVGANFGSADLDGDGADEVLVGVPNDDTTDAGAGAAYLVGGSWSGERSLSDADAKVLGMAAGDEVGSSIAGVGDVDDDGYEDLLVGAPNQDEEGAAAGSVYLVAGGATYGDMDGQEIGDVYAATWRGDEDGDNLGTAVAGGADFDGDGTPDLLLGAAYRGIYDQGSIYLVTEVHTGDADIGESAHARIDGGTEDDMVGATLSFAGDLAGDGSETLLVPVAKDDAEATDAGATYLLFDIGY